jgi:hypothetical protein
MKRIIRWGITGGVIVSWALLLSCFWTNCPVPFGPIIEDASKRIESPDDLKTALLVRRLAFDLSFDPKIVDGNRTQKIYTSPDYDTFTVIVEDERIRWSRDSSLLVCASVGIRKNSPPHAWAFDFSAIAPAADSGNNSGK